MKNKLRLCLSLLWALAPMALFYAQTSYETVSTRRDIYSDPRVMEAVDFLQYRLPQLVVEDKDKAIEEYLVHYENLSNLDEIDVLYLVGHFYASVDDAKTAIPYFDLLINDTRLGEDARRMLNLLLYYRAVHYLQEDDKQAAQDFLTDALNLFPTGRFYPTYLFLWADLIAESKDHGEVTRYIDNYNANRDWIQNVFRPRKAAIIQRIDNLDLERYYQNPTDAEFYLLDSEISTIQSDLQTLYVELIAIPGLLTAESLNRISAEELSLLEDLKNQLKSYNSPPDLDLDMLASADYSVSEMSVYNKYRDGAILLTQLKGTSDYYGKVLDIMDRIFEQRYELFVNEDPSVVGKGFSDMEMKRLFDIERNIDIYNRVIEEIDKVMADPDYPKLNIDMRPERQEYVEKLADLQNRKDRYLAYRKHQDGVEEAIFNELLEEYYALNRERNTLDRLLPEIEDVMIAMIKENFPKDQQKLINGQLALTSNVASSNLAMDDNLNSFLANLDFIHLQLDYRNLRYREQQRLAEAGGLSEADMQAQYQELLAAKANLLKRHQDFVAQNPDFQALEQPSGGYLLNNAIIYYNMAELQYAVDLDHPELALGYYRKVLQIDPEFFLRDYALYNIGYLSSEYQKDVLDVQISNFRASNPNKDRPDNLKYSAGLFNEALDAYTELTGSGRYDASPLRDEAIYRLGVLNFLIGSDAAEPVVYYAEANRLFDTLVNDPQSDYRYEALYQRGWVNMNRGDEASLKLAMDDFITLIGAVDSSRVSNQYLATDYKSNAVDNIAYSLIALDGADFNSEARGISEMQLALADYQDARVKTRILDKATLLKTDMQAPLQAIDYLELRLQTSPLDLINPTIVDSIIKLYHTPKLQLRAGTDLASIRAAKQQFIKDQYNNESEWYRQNVRDRDLASPAIQAQLQVIKKAYEEIRVRRYNELLSAKTPQALEAYTDHVEDYAAYRELFGDEYQQWLADNARTETLLTSHMAEGNQTPIDFLRAIGSLTGYNAKNSGSADFFNNEGLIYKYAQSIYAQMDPTFADPAYQPEPGLPATQQELYEFYRDASIRFYGVLVSPEYASSDNWKNSAQIMMDLAQIEEDRDLPTPAKSRYLTLLENADQLDGTTLRGIYLSLASLEEKGQDYKQSENWYRQAYKYALNDKDARDIDHQIKLQIQNNYEQAEGRGDYATVAQEYIRLSDEYANDPDKYAGYRYQASEAYKQAGLHQEAIDLKLALAQAKQTREEKYFLYYESWTIADSLKNDRAQGTRLKNDFIAMYPGSNLAFNLRVDAIEAMRAEPATRVAAAEQYLALHDEVRAGKIDSGAVAPEDIYLWAIDIYREERDQNKIVELLTYFTQTYPEHEQNAAFLTLLADEYLARGDEQKFAYYSRELYLRDSGKADRYLTTAQKNLGTIAREFDAAYQDGDWDGAFAKRDEFKKVEAQYVKEGLSLDTAQAYAAFGFAEKEYEVLQARLAYLRGFDRQLSAIEQGEFLTSSPNQLIMVNPNTTWKQHLFGGKPNRVPALQARTEREYARILKMLEQPEADDLDNARRLRALTLICRISDYAAEVTQTQINKYIQVSNEIYPFKDKRQFTQAQYDALVNNDLLPFAQEYIDQFRATSTAVYLDIYRNYALAGYTDKYTQQAETVLKNRNQLPVYKEEAAPLNSKWDLTLQTTGGEPKKINSGLSNATTTRGIELAGYSIPGNAEMILERDFDLQATPDFVFLHLAYPQDPEIYLNGSKLDLVYIPVDSLDAGSHALPHYAVRIAGNLWKQGNNSFRGVFSNQSAEPIPFHFNSSFFYDQAKLAESLLYETGKISSEAGWSVYVPTPGTAEETASEAVRATTFELPVSRSEFLQDSQAQPVWVAETPTEPVTDLAFELTFDVWTAYRQGYLDFVAPDYASIYVNGQALSMNSPMQYETDPFTAYPTRVEIPASLVVTGQNTVRIVIQNQSPYRGMIAELVITQAARSN